MLVVDSLTSEAHVVNVLFIIINDYEWSECCNFPTLPQ